MEAVSSDLPARPQVKICGLTRPEDAEACLAAGVDALGCIFFPPSRRHVTPEGARALAEVSGGRAPLVGVFVDAGLEEILRTAAAAGLEMVQLHGREAPELVARVQAAGLPVIKALFERGDPGPEQARRYRPTAFLVECAGGPLPGGNALAWDWGRAAAADCRPLILAGGLTPGNIGRAVAVARPEAVDVSSGVVRAPGIKDPARIAALMAALRRASGAVGPSRVFEGRGASGTGGNRRCSVWPCS
jgi:phosphoribosylanthranilate isomerase